MYIINFRGLQIGDVILTRYNTRECRLIRASTNSDYSHAILYVGVGSAIESNGLGVQSINVLRQLFKNDDDVVVLRFNQDMTQKQVNDIDFFAREKIGTEYSTKEARLSRLKEILIAKEVNRQFCTRFVAQAYEKAGFKIVENPDYCTPQEILDSQQFTRVEGLVLSANEKEIEYATEVNHPIDQQTEITNVILEKARNLTNEDIQTFEQLSKYVLENLDKESTITQIIKDSGYLDMWKKDCERNPWHYDYEEALTHYKNKNQRKEVGEFFFNTEKQTRQRFIISLDAMEFGYKYFNQEYFQIQIELCEKLIELSKQREKVGLQLISG